MEDLPPGIKPQVPPLHLCGLLLLPVCREDIQEMRRWRNHEEVRSCFVYDKPISEEEQESWYRSYLEKEDDIVWIAREEHSLEKVGSVALYRIDREQKTAEIGRLILAEGMGGRGYGKILLDGALQLGFTALGLEEIRVKVFYDNLPSMHINLSLGFVPCGVEQIGGKYLIQMKRKKDDADELF